MNIREALLLENSKRNFLEIAAYIGEDSARFAELMKIFFAGEYRLTQRAAYVFMICVERFPDLVKPFLKKLVAGLKRKGVEAATRRNVVRMRMFIELPKYLEGRIYSHCIDLIDDMNEQIAVRAFALTVATRIGKHEPALVNELCLIVKKHLPQTTVGFHHRAKEILACQK